MAIYDHNGSANTEIGKIYDHNGTSNTQIGKVYDHNGSVNTLIYSAEESVYPGTTPTTQKNDTQTSLTNVGSFYANTSNSSGGGGRAYVAVDVSGWDTLTVQWTAESGTYATIFVGLCKSLPVTENGYQWYLDSQCTKVSQQTFCNGTKVSKKTTQTTTVNVSALSGTYYLLVNAYSGSSVDAYAGGSITSAILS